MNEHDSVDPTAGMPQDGPVDGEGAKPKRRRAPRKSAEAVPAVDAATVTAPQDHPVAPDDAAPAPKAPRRRRAPAPAAESVEGAPAVERADAPSAEPAARAVEPMAPAEPVRTPAARRAARRGDAEGGATSPDAERLGAEAVPAGDQTEASAPPPATGEEGGPREGNRRRRNRRRNRDRDRGDRPPRPDGEASGPADVTDDEAVAAVPVADLERTDPGELFAEVLSGAFDVDPAAEAGAVDEGADATPTAAPKRVLAPEPDAPKLHKVLAQAGIGSRRDMEQWMLEGRVTVNGEPAHVGQRISFGDRIAVNGKPVKVRIAPPPPRVLAYHKPAGEVVTHDDPQHRPTVFRRLPRLPHGKWQSVGRLDLNTEGLLLFTNSGELANQLMHPRFGVEREYAVRSLGVLDDEQRQRLLDGVEIDGQRSAFSSIVDGGGEGVNHWYRVVITEGRYREVRRLFESVGHAVSRLIRIRYGCVVLPRGLKRGVWVDLSDNDVKALRRLTGTDRERDRERTRDAEGGAGARGKRGRRGGRSRDRDRPPRDGQPEGSPRVDHDAPDSDVPMNIPNPLQQTYDKRFIQQARSQRRELSEDDPIPNPLQQTYDRRALQHDRRPVRDLPEDGPIPNPLQQTYDKRFVQKDKGPRGGRGGPGGGRGGGAGGGGAGRQPDPMQTSMGYIGADALRGKRSGKGGGKPGFGGRKGGGGPGGGSGGGPGGAPRGNRGGRGGGRSR